MYTYAVFYLTTGEIAYVISGHQEDMVHHVSEEFGCISVPEGTDPDLFYVQEGALIPR